MSLSSVDFLGVKDFVYGGDQEWVRRRWFMVITLSVGWLSAVTAVVANAFGRISDDTTKSVIDGYFYLIMVVIPGYLGFGVWDKKIQMENSVVEKIETVTQESPSKVSKETKITAPVDNPDG